MHIIETQTFPNQTHRMHSEANISVIEVLSINGETSNDGAVQVITYNSLGNYRPIIPCHVLRVAVPVFIVKMSAVS